MSFYIQDRINTTINEVNEEMHRIFGAMLEIKLREAEQIDFKLQPTLLELEIAVKDALEKVKEVAASVSPS